MTDPEQIAAVAKGLSAMEAERLTGWQGPIGAAYNCISEDLCEMGLLNNDWLLSPKGAAVAQYLKDNHP